jgi:hypothetical protein
MKRNFKYILYSGLVLGTLFSSCKKEFLDQPPYTSTDATIALATEADVLTALNGTYAGLRSATLYGRTLPLLGDLQADNVFISTRNSGRYTAQNLNNFISNNADVLGIWQNAYMVILRANNIINSTPAVTVQANVNQYKGEAYAIRALMYFELVRTFARPYTDTPTGLGVPIVTGFNIDAKPARATVDAVYTQILADLDQAYTLCTLKPTTARLSKYAARALAAKVNLTKGTPASLQLAYDQSVEVINSSGTTLLTAANFTTYWTTMTAQASASPNETLFEVVSDQVDNAGFDELAYFYNQQGYGDGLTSKTFYDSFSATDVRKSLILVTTRTRAENPAYVVNKYPNISNYGTKKILRISDVYLIAAESAYDLGRPVDAITYLTRLVAQRDPAATVTEAGAPLFERIITERRKELAFEGDRLHTLNRLKRDVTGRNGSVTAIPYTNYRRVAPIPLNELDRNSAVVQNPGY